MSPTVVVHSWCSRSSHPKHRRNGTAYNVARVRIRIEFVRTERTENHFNRYLHLPEVVATAPSSPRP
jgi:hypothetical protein